MKLPKIDMSLLPDLDRASGMFGSLSEHASAFSDDRIIILMVYLYEQVPPPPAPPPETFMFF